MFIGTREIEKIEDGLVFFVDGGKTQYTEKALTYITSDEAMEDSDLQMLTVDNVAADILKVLEEHDIRFFDVNLIMQKVKWSCDAYSDRMMAKAAWLQDEFDGITDKQIRNIRVSHTKNFLNS